MKHFSIEVQKLDHIYTNLLSALLAVLALSTMLLYSYYGVVDTQNLLTWYILNIIVIFLRIILLFSYNKTIITQNNFSFYYITFFILSSSTALLWGASAFFIFPSQIEYQIIILLFLAGLISGASASISLYIAIL